MCVFAYEYFVFLGRVTNPSAKPPFLEDQFVSLSLASLLRPVRLGRPCQEQKVPAGIARKVIEVNLKISTDKTKIMALKVKHLVRSKIEIDGSILEQVKQFNYLGCELSLTKK